MLRQIIVIFSCVFCFYGSTVQAKTQDAFRNLNQQQIDAAPKRGALFKITKANHTLFLFGTIHVGSADFYPLESTVMNALKVSSKIALEIDPLQTKKTDAAVQQYGLYQSGRSLKLSTEQRARLTALLKARNIPYDVIAVAKPWMAATIITLNEFSAQGFKSEYAVDSFIAEFARRNKKPIVELETVEGQLATFGNLSESDQVLYLEDTMKEIEDKSGIEKVARLTRLWRTADGPGMEAMSDELAADPTFSGKFFQTVLLDQRNPGLATGIGKLMMSEKNSFAGIGMFHLVGKKSVPAILKQRGYVVERIY